MKMSINIAKFIQDVKDRPAIWDRGFPHDIAFRKDTWDELCEIHRSSKAEIRTKWKNLRDNFRIIYKRIPRDENGQLLQKPEEYDTRWPFYKQLLFLGDHIHPRTNPKGDTKELQESEHNGNENFSDNLSVDSMAADNENDADDKMNYIAIPELVFSEPPPLAVLSAPPPPLPTPAHVPKLLPKKRVFVKSMATIGESPQRTRVENESFPPLKKIKIEAGEARTAEDILLQTAQSSMARMSSARFDDDYHFLMSLHPYLQDLNPAQKLRIRMKIQSLIFRELYKDEDPN